MFDTSLCPSRDDPLNKILDFVSEQTKHTGMHLGLLCYDEILFCPFVLEDARHQSISASTQPSQTRYDRPKITYFMGEKHTPLNPPDRATTISLNPPDRVTNISCLITMECIANQYPTSIVRSRECCRKK